MGLLKNLLYSASSEKMLNFFTDQTIFTYYHTVNNEKLNYLDNLFSFKNEKHFKNDIELLLNNYQPLNPDFFLKDFKYNQIPKNHFLLTFDDGLSQIFDVIAPILYEKKISAIFFVNPHYIDNKNFFVRHVISVLIDIILNNKYDKEIIQEINYLLSLKKSSSKSLLINDLKKINFDSENILLRITELLKVDINTELKKKKPFISKNQIKEMIDMGFYFGGHTMTHPRLNTINYNDQKKEIIDSINWLKLNFKINYSFFAFPYTDRGISKKLIKSIFKYDNSSIVFGNSGLKKDFDERIIQRFSLEKPNQNTSKLIVSENLYKFCNKLIGNYNITRN